MPITTVTGIEELRGWVDEQRGAGRRVGFVPTMGALHAGHGRLITEASRGTDAVIVSIFVNPTQFGPGEDFERYPRTESEDTKLCECSGATLIFRPMLEAVYPPERLGVYVEVPGLSEVLEGASRPGHFRGVATVVLKLLLMVRADRAYFGQKDLQQLAVIRALVRELDVPVEIVEVPTVREPDGLALSSRNRYLGPEDRRAATVLFRALETAVEEVRRGTSDVGVIESAMRAVVQSEPRAELDYAVLADPARMRRPDQIRSGQPISALIAARVGPARLIDNRPLPTV